MSISDADVIDPSTSARTFPVRFAIAPMIESEAIPPNEPAVASASALFCWPFSFASTLTTPDDATEPVEPMNASTSWFISASATAPVSPTTDTPITITVAVATFSPIAWIVTPVELEIVPSTSARVCPATIAIGMRMAMVTPPAEPPGAVASAVCVPVALTRTEPVVSMLELELRVASALRASFACATVTPTARAPVATLMVLACASAVPTADREVADVAQRVGGHVGAAACLMNGGAVVDVGVLGALVIEHGALRPAGNEAAGAGEGDRVDRLVHPCVDRHVVAAAVARGDLGAGADLRLGRALDVEDLDAGADPHQPAWYRPGAARTRNA